MSGKTFSELAEVILPDQSTQSWLGALSIHFPKDLALFC